MLSPPSDPEPSARIVHARRIYTGVGISPDLQKIWRETLEFSAGRGKSVPAQLTTDNDLVTAAIAGDRHALAELLTRHAPALRAELRIAGRFQHLLEVDDVLQVTFFEAFANISSYAGDGAAFGRWLWRIAQRNLVDAYRLLGGKKRFPQAARQDPPETTDLKSWLEAIAIGTDTTPTRVAVRNENRELLRAALSKLPADYARVIEAHDLDERPIGDVARMMGRTVGAVYLLRTRAIDRLRTLLGPSADTRASV